jgi:hypothetical protein
MSYSFGLSSFVDASLKQILTGLSGALQSAKVGEKENQ